VLCFHPWVFDFWFCSSLTSHWANCAISHLRRKWIFFLWEALVNPEISRLLLSHHHCGVAILPGPWHLKLKSFPALCLSLGQCSKKDNFVHSFWFSCLLSSMESELCQYVDIILFWFLLLLLLLTTLLLLWLINSNE
jgi:hypothetical protein